MGVDPKIGRKLIAEIDAAELTVRLLEIGCALKRPPGQSAAQTMGKIEQSVIGGQIPAGIVTDFKKMAEAAIMYFCECCANLRTVQ